MAYDIYLSSSPSPVIAAIIWSLVFHFIIFRAYITFVEAVILILKHATFLRLSDLTAELALTRAELHYREANIDLKIRQYLTASSQEHSVEQLAGFIMATDIGSFILGSVKIISHQAVSVSSVFSQQRTCIEKIIGLNDFRNQYSHVSLSFCWSCGMISRSSVESSRNCVVELCMIRYARLL